MGFHQIVETVINLSPAYICLALAILTIYYSFPDTSRGRILPGAPIVGAKSRFEPLWLTKLRFTFQGWEISHEGWTKFPNSMFTIVRPESSITLIPKRYIDELRNISDDRLAAVEAIVEDLMSEYTGIDILRGSHLSHMVVKTRLVPRLGNFIPYIEKEIKYGFEHDFSDCKSDWVVVDLNKAILRVVSRITARLFVGAPLCRNEEWLRLNEDIVTEIFTTVVIMRLFPRYLHRIIGALLPSRRRLWQYSTRIKDFLVPLIHERRQRQLRGEEPDEDITTWMMELADGAECRPENIAQRYIYTVIGSLHTVTAAVVDTIYELFARPEYIEPLRKELLEALGQENGWNKATTNELQMMDSFIKEVQRVNPPSARQSLYVGFKRIVKDPNGITLSDGLHLPRGTRLCVPSTTHLQDTLAQPGSFDGFRYHRKRNDIGYSTRDQFTATDQEHVHFGHGRYACPGRFVASNEIKMVVGELILRYDVKFPKGRGRPANKTILELSFQDPQARVLMRERVV